MYKYSIYGLNVVSEIKLYQLKQTENENNPKVWVRYEVIEQEIVKKVQAGIHSSMEQNKVWFHNDVGYFVVENGTSIVVDAYCTASEGDIASFILGWGIAFLFMQRNVSAIHCSTIQMNQQAVAIAGSSGAGKSTVTLSLLKKGYRYLTDDIAMVDISNDFYIQPGFPQQKVCRNIAERMDSEKLFYINEKKDKFAYNNFEEFCTKPQKLTAMFILEIYEGEDLFIQEIKGLDKWNRVIDNLFLNEAYRNFGFPLEEKKRCLEIAGNLKMYRICRPENKDTAEEICTRIIELVKQNV